MGLGVLVIGESGSGKTYSMRNLPPAETAFINVQSKPIPFKKTGDFLEVKADAYANIKNAMLKAGDSDKVKYIVIDDVQYVMANEFMRRSSEKGFDKFTEIAHQIWDLINTVGQLPDDKIVYFLSHEEDGAAGKVKMKTIGKLLDEKITVEGMFTIVLRAVKREGKHLFLTATDGYDTVKSPPEMFSDEQIDNDLKIVDDSIREFYGMNVKSSTKKGE
jgi:hypothetical protein